MIEGACEDLIKQSMTCPWIWELSNQQTHYGGCSHCIDSRFAVLSVNLPPSRIVAMSAGAVIGEGGVYVSNVADC